MHSWQLYFLVHKMALEGRHSPSNYNDNVIWYLENQAQIEEGASRTK